MIFLIIIVSISVYIAFIWCIRKYFPGMPSRADRCQKGVCGFFHANGCGNRSINITLEEFKKRRGKTYEEFSGKPGKWPCSVQFMGFDNPHDHENHILQMKKTRFTFILTIILSSLSFILATSSFVMCLVLDKCLE